jgi:hypothetical protein
LFATCCVSTTNNTSSTVNATTFINLGYYLFRPLKGNLQAFLVFLFTYTGHKVAKYVYILLKDID